MGNKKVLEPVNKVYDQIKHLPFNIPSVKWPDGNNNQIKYKSCTIDFFPKGCWMLLTSQASKKVS